MDPNAALQALMEAFSTEDRDEALAIFGVLKHWLLMGGFLPTETANRMLGSKPLDWQGHHPWGNYGDGLWRLGSPENCQDSLVTPQSSLNLLHEEAIRQGILRAS